MSRRKPTPESELLDDLKATSLEAAAQVLSGLSLARKLSESVRERYTGRLEQKLGLEADSLPSMGDLLFKGTRLHVDHARAVMKFQRWVSDAVFDGMQQAVDADTCVTEVTSLERTKLVGKLGEVAVLSVKVKNRARETKSVRGHTQVQLRRGTRAYLEWAQQGPTPAELAGGAEAEVRIPVALTQAMLRVGSYVGTCVIELGDDVRHFPLEIVVEPAAAE